MAETLRLLLSALSPHTRYFTSSWWVGDGTYTSQMTAHFCARQ